jgi:SAM-dependent methyltransferase
MVESPVEQEAQVESVAETAAVSWAAVKGCLVPNSPVLALPWTNLGETAQDEVVDPAATSQFDELAESDFQEENEESDDLEPDELEESSMGSGQADETQTSRVEARSVDSDEESLNPPMASLSRATASVPVAPAASQRVPRVSTGSVPTVGPPPPPSASRPATGAMPRIPPPLPKQATGSVASVDSSPTARMLRPAPPDVPPAQSSAGPAIVPVASAYVAQPPTVETGPRALQQRPADDLAAMVQELISAEANPTAARAVPDVKVSRQHWFAEIFDESWLRTLPENTWRRTVREVQFVLDSLRMPVGATVLDMACGHGRHALELSARGYQVTGVDLSRVFLERAHREAQRRSLTPRFMVGDMRDVAFEAEFDAAICLNTSFGFFDDVTNYGIVTSIFRALRPGGQFILDTVNRDYITANVPRRRWWDNAELIIMEEVDFDAQTSRLKSLRTLVDERQRPWEQHISIRLYGAHELCGMLAMAGFEIVEMSGDIAHRGSYLGAVNRSVIITARKPA